MPTSQMFLASIAAINLQTTESSFSDRKPRPKPRHFLLLFFLVPQYRRLKRASSKRWPKLVFPGFLLLGKAFGREMPSGNRQ